MGRVITLDLTLCSTLFIYQTPSADLIDHDRNDQIFQFNRFTAWAVFGLGFITLGLYSVYWLCNRANKVNVISENKIENYWIATFAISTVLSFCTGFLDDSDAAVFISLFITVVYLVSYIVVAFKLRNRLSDMMSSNSNEKYNLSGALTFLFSAIYLQYKINEYIDNHK